MGWLKLSNVGKAFDGTVVLEDINLEIADGEFLVFVGPSGCGKSTLLRIIAGLEEATGGEIAIDGHVVNSGLTKVCGGSSEPAYTLPGPDVKV